MINTIEPIKKELRDYCTHLKEMLKEDIMMGWISEQKSPVTRKQHVAVVPLPQEITIEELVELSGDTYYVTFNIRCGLRFFSTKCFIGKTLDADKVSTELRRCINTAIEQCLKYDKGEIREVCESSGNIINIQSL